MKTVLVGGIDNLAGELGHVAVAPATVKELNAARPKGLGRLQAVSCSCVDAKEPVPHHVEAYAAVGPVTRRIAAKQRAPEVLERLREPSPGPVEVRALEDAGRLVGEALLGPIGWLNPASIVLTGSLSHAIVRKAVDDRIESEPLAVTHPKVTHRSGNDNDYIRVRGAALAVLREHVHRKLPDILRGTPESVAEQVHDLVSFVDPGT
jgi:hypothetical protein